MGFNDKYYDTYQQGTNANSWEAGKRKRAYLYRTFLRALLPYVNNPSTVMEVGCGVGYMSWFLAHHWPKAQILAGDFSESAMNIAQRNLGDITNIVLSPVDAMSMQFEDETAELLICMDVVEHLPQPMMFFNEAYRVLKPNGILFISTPNPGSLGNRLKGHRRREVGRPYAERMLEWSGWRDDTHINIKVISDWRQIAENTGLELVKDGTDYCWDAPYFRRVPLLLQKIIFIGSMKLIYQWGGPAFLPWSFGENYMGIYRKKHYE